jgi:hypothetical protein
MRNVLAVLAEAGTDPEHVAKLTIYLAAGADPQAGYEAAFSVWGDRRTAVTVLAVTPTRPGGTRRDRGSGNDSGALRSRRWPMWQYAAGAEKRRLATVELPEHS